MVVIAQSGCFLANVVLFRQSGCIREKVVVFGKKWFYFGRSGCIRAKVVVFLLIDVIRRSGRFRKEVAVFLP